MQKILILQRGEKIGAVLFQLAKLKECYWGLSYTNVPRPLNEPTGLKNCISQSKFPQQIKHLAESALDFSTSSTKKTPNGKLVFPVWV